MKVARKTIATAIADLSVKRTSAKDLANQVAAYLLSEHRTAELDSLMRDVSEERSRHGVVEVEAVSAHALDQRSVDDVKTEVKAIYPQAQEVIVSPRIEPALIGGIRLEFPNSVLDLSLRNRLNHLKQLITYGKD